MIFIDQINDITDRKERLRFILILFFVFSLPFDVLYSSVLVILLSLITLFDSSKDKFKGIPRHFFLFQMVFFLSAAGYFYSLHKSGASFLMERQLTIFLLPVILPMAISITKEKINLTLVVLSLSSFIAVVYLFAAMFYSIVEELKMPLFQTISSGAFFNHQFSKPLDIHAGYLSLYISLSILFLTHRYDSGRSMRRKVLLILLLSVLFSGLFFLASRNIIIATFFILVFVYPFYKVKNKVPYILILTAILVSSFLLIRSIPYLHERFSVNLITDINPIRSSQGITYSINEPRYERWKGAAELIKRSPLVGYGTGDEIPMLKTEYIKRGHYISYLENYNAHNQYLSYLLKNGIVGLLIFLFIFGYYLRLALKSKNFEYLSFLIILLIGFYTENILDANKGIVFFAFFNTLLGYYALRKIREDASAHKVTPTIDRTSTAA